MSIFGAIAPSISNWVSAVTKSVNGLVGYEGVEDRDGYWKMMQKYIGSDVTSMVTLPVIIFEPMTMLQKMAELMEYSHLLDMTLICAWCMRHHGLKVLENNLPKNGNASATTKVERTKIVLRNIDTPLDLIFSEEGISSSKLSTIGVRVKAYLVIGVMT
ncbi:hypothetical protein F2Q70_00009751 [Brassica cretica]|uniref:Uncharacterized protein n=1 Tax=Brassica cretica TaxID=69181 RepID=A0A8S9M140_BRACR|nr:hypothetical protein F2Q70_00009751 [Brassica cretica]